MKQILWLLALTFCISSTQAQYRLYVDIEDDGIKYTNTENRIMVSFWSSNKELAVTTTNYSTSIHDPAWTGSTGMGGRNPYYYSVNTKENITHVIIETSGDDGFWIDRVYLEKLRYGTHGPTIKEWGQDGGKGWCLSTDKNDGLGAWKSKIDNNTGCRQAFKFDLQDEKVYAVSPPQHQKELPGIMNYLVIDHKDGSIENEETSNRITFKFYDRSGNLLRTKELSPKKPGESTITAKTKESPAYITAETSGSDGFWIDEISYYRFHRDRKYAQWGRDGGKGWCLSTDPMDGAGAWSEYTNGCYSKIKLDIPSEKVITGSNPLKDYEVTVITGNTSGGGTNSNIYLTIYGNKGNTGSIKLNPHISGNAFERGKTDRCTLRNLKDVGTVNRVKIYSDGKGAGSDWSCYMVKVKKERSSVKSFEFGEWINSKETAYRPR